MAWSSPVSTRSKSSGVSTEPVRAESGKHKGTVIMQEEQDQGLAFMPSLPAAQQKKALINGEKGGTNNLAEAFKENLIVANVGIRASEFDEAGKRGLLDLIAIYVNHQDEGHAKVRLSEVKSHLDETYFAWIGSTGKDAVFYYHIQSPVIYVEFDHQRPIGLKRTNIPSRVDIHAVIRIPNGNDYGKSLLQQHHEKHHTK